MSAAVYYIPMPTSLSAGMVLGRRYEILGEIARGSMGIVYKARHLKLGGLVAIKVMAEGFRQNPEMVARFKREAELSHQIRHPNVVQVLDCDETPWGAPYLVEELLEGRDLQARLDAG